MTTRTSILTLTALAAVSVISIATSASAHGFLAPRPIFVPGQVVENCNVNPRLGCAVHIDPTPVTPVATCPWRRAHISVRVAVSLPYEIVSRPHIRASWPIHTFPRHHVWY